MSLINTKIKNTNQLYNQIKKYTEEIPKFNKHEFSSNIKNDMSNIEKTLPKLKNLSNIQNLDIDDLFKLWNFINEILHQIKSILVNLEPINIRYQKKFVSDISESEAETINDLYGNMIVSYKKYKKDNVKLDSDIINELNDIIQQKLKWNKSNVKDNTDILTDLVKKMPHAVSLYAFVIQKSIDVCLSFSDEICHYILNKVEDAKDHIMLHDQKVQNGKKELYKNNPGLKTFGLTPTGESDELKNITNKLFGTSISSISKLGSLAKKEKVCIVVMNHIIKNPIEFSLWKMINRNLSQQYSQNPESGITQKTIDKFDNVGFRPLGKGKKWNFDIDHYGNIDSEYFIVLENLSYTLYRIYSIYDEIPIIGGGKQYTKIHKSKIPEFIEYVKNKGVLKTNSRIQEYNRIQEKMIVNNMFLPIKFNIHGIKMDSQIIDSKFLRHELFLQLLNQINNIIKKQFADGTKIKTFKDIGQIIHDSSLVDIFNSILIEQYDIYAIKNKEHSSKFPFSETLQTFLSVLFDMNTDFRRLTHDYYINTKIDPKILEMPNTSKKIELQNIFKEIINDVLKKIISDNRNIYQELIYKNSLLKLSLY